MVEFLYRFVVSSLRRLVALHRLFVFVVLLFVVLFIGCFVVCCCVVVLLSCCSLFCWFRLAVSPDFVPLRSLSLVCSLVGSFVRLFVCSPMWSRVISLFVYSSVNYILFVDSFV